MSHHLNLEMPNIPILRAVVFGIFALASLAMAGGLQTARGGFRAADVDVLFATPVSPEYVLVFRMARDYMFTLIAPLVLALVGWRGTSMGVSMLFRNYPAHSMDVLRAAWIAWMLLSFAFVSLGYGSSLFIGRSDLRSDSNEKLLTNGINVAVLAVIAYIGYKLHDNLSWRTGVDFGSSTFLNVVFLPATLATDFVIGSLTGNVVVIMVSLGGLVSTIALGLALALTQVGWLYDQASAKGVGASLSRKLRGSGDMYGLAAERARKGKRSASVMARGLSRLTYRESGALVWKELLLQLRGPMSGAVLSFCALLLAYGMMGWILSNHGELKTSSQIFEIALPSMAAYMLGALNGFGGFTEMLKRVDLLKPLPFTPGRIVLYEALAKAPIPIFMLAGCAVELTIFTPGDGLAHLAGFLVGSTLLLEITGSILFAVVLFPDLQDPTQRMLNGIIMLLTICICSAPGFGLYIVLSAYLHWPSILAAIPTSLFFVGVMVGLSTLSGSIYAHYNPSE
jgi:hypothetical protein